MLEGRAGVQEDFTEEVILRLAWLQVGDVEETKDKQHPSPLLALNTSPPHPLVFTGRRAIHPEALFLSQACSWGATMWPSFG